MKWYKLLNHYFFGEESINLSDAFWFYGTYSTITIISIAVCLSVL